MISKISFLRNSLLLKHGIFFERNRGSRPEVFCKKGILRNFAKFTGKHLCESLFNKVAGAACNFIKKETLAQVFFCEFCEICKNTFFTEHSWGAASSNLSKKNWAETPVLLRNNIDCD